MNSKIGGQAVIEGVMMKNADKYAVAVRKTDGDIVVDLQKTGKEHGGIAKAPIIRGVVAFVDSLVIGMKTLTYSASLFEDEEETEKNSKKTKEQSERSEKLVLGATVVFSIIMAIAIFMILPWFISQFLLSKLGLNEYLLAVCEGLCRLVIFVIYIVAISQMEDIRRVFMYHGAEHKSINCVENGLDLTIENVRKQSRCHKRCGTSFMFFVIIVSIIVFMFIRVSNPALQALIRILLVPVIAGISYEFIRFFGNSESKLAAALSKPGFMFQNLTTREPDDSMIEVAIASVEAVFDWKPFVAMVREEGKLTKNEKSAKKEKPAKNTKAGQSEEDAKAKAAAREEAKARRKAEAVNSIKELEEKEREAAEEAIRNAAAEAERKAAEEERAARAAKVAALVESNAKKAEAESEDDDKTANKLRKDNGLSSLDKVLFVKKDAPVKEFKDPLASQKVKVQAVESDEDDEVLSALDKFFEFKGKNE